MGNNALIWSPKKNKILKQIENEGIISSTVSGPVSRKKKTNWIEFLKLNLQNSLSMLANKSRFEAWNMVLSYYFLIQ